MKRDIASISTYESAGYRDSVPPSGQPRTGVAGNGSGTGIADQENDHRTIGIEQGPIEAMPFPGLFAVAAPPDVVNRFLESDGIARPTAPATSAATDTPASATAPAVHADATANGAFPAVAGNHTGQTAPPDAPECNPDGLPPLILAARLGKLDEVQMLLDESAVDIDQIDSRFRSTALMFAAEEGNCDVVVLLLARGADVNFRNPRNGTTALMCASAEGHLSVVEALLKCNHINVDVARTDGLNALALASKEGRVEVVEALLAAGANVNFRNPRYGTTALMYASVKGHLSVVKALLEVHGIDVDGARNDGFNALGLASYAGYVDIVKALLAAHADVNFKPFGNSRTALIYAARKGKAAVVALLLEHHRRIGPLFMPDAKWALLLAAGNGHVDIFKQLIAAGVDFNFLNHPSGKTPLIMAAAAGQLEMVKALLEFPGIVVNELGADGRHVLSWASESGNVDIVETLIGAKADLGYVDPSRQTNVDRAFIAGHANIVECLFGHGGAVSNGKARFPAKGRHAVCLADLFRDRSMSAVSAYDPVRAFDARWFNNPDSFFSELLTVVKQSAGADVDAAVTSWLDSLGIRRAVIAPLMQSLGNLSEVWRLLSAEGQSSPTERQMLAYFSGTISQLAVLAPDQKISAPYREAGLSPAGLERLSKLAIAQRNQLVALAEKMTAQIAEQILNKLVADCHGKTSPTLLVDADALRNSLIREGFVPPLARVLADSWHAAMAELASMPLPMGPPLSMLELLALLDESLTSDGLRLFIRKLAQRLGSAAVLAEGRAMLGDTNAEGLHAMFDDQCRHLRQYCEEIGSGKE